MGKKKIGHEEKEPSVVRLPITSRSGLVKTSIISSESKVFALKRATKKRRKRKKISLTAR